MMDYARSDLQAPATKLIRIADDRIWEREYALSNATAVHVILRMRKLYNPMQAVLP